jgi:hypothetical protein
MEVRQLRGQLVSYILENESPEYRAAADRLAESDPSIRKWLATHRASSEARKLLPLLNPAGTPDAGALSVPEAVKILDRADYRLIRSPDDLLDAILESLGNIQSEVGHDLPMLYGAPDRSGAQNQPRRHLEEDALQAYLRRTLAQSLPRLADEVQVQIIREDEVARRQRLDIRVIAPCHGTRELAQVVVEVKWSDNPETKTGLVSQLGQRYLLGEKLTHGIFLVGWSGDWRPGDGTGTNTNLSDLERFLARQREKFCAPGQPGERLRIEPYVLDLRWRLPKS